MAWQTIKTAPRDRLILLWAEDRCWVAWWHNERSDWVIDFEESIGPPTHWMPLPSSPHAPSS